MIPLILRLALTCQKLGEVAFYVMRVSKYHGEEHEHCYGYITRMSNLSPL
nr:MAG TPA: hypothetical protein [Caudoviricetes sp.]